MKMCIEENKTSYVWKDGTELIVGKKGFEVWDKNGQCLFDAKED